MSKQNVPALRLEGFSGEWEVSPLSEISELNPSASVPAHFEYVDLASVLGTEMTSHQSTSSSEAPSRAQRVARYGDIFYQTVRPYQKNNYHFMIDSDCDFVFSTGYAQIRPLIDGEFLFTAVQREDFLVQVLDRCTGTGYPAIAPNALGKIQLSYPPTLEEQQAIGAIFTNLDEAINQHMLKHKALQQSKTALMQRMFPQEGQTVPELRLEGFSGEWKPVRLDAFDIKTGPFGSTLHAEDYVAVGTPIVTTEHFKSGQLPDTGDSIPQVSKQDTARLSMYLLDEGDIVFSRVGSVDINARVARHQKGWLFSGRVLRLRLDASCDVAFLHSALETEQVRTSIISRAVGQTMPSINTKILGATEVFIPPTLEEQQAIGAVFTNLDQLIAAEARFIVSLKQAKTALLQRMFI